MKITHALLSMLLLIPSANKASNDASVAVKLCTLGAALATGTAAYLWHNQRPSFATQFFALERARDRTKMKDFFAKHSTHALEQATVEIDNRSMPLILWLFERARAPQKFDFDFHMTIFKHLALDRKCDINKPIPGQFSTDILNPFTVLNPSLLHIACMRSGYTKRGTELLRLLIRAQANVNALSSHAHTPLALCCAGNLFNYARILIEAGARVGRHGVGFPPLEIALGDCRRYENGLTTLLLVTGARDIPDHYHDPQKVVLPRYLLDLFEASYDDLLHIVAQQNNPAHRSITYGPKRHALSPAHYAQIMERRLQNLTEPSERFDCAVRLRYLQEPLQSWRTFEYTAPWVSVLDAHMPAVVSDVVLDYALPNLGPIMPPRIREITNANSLPDTDSSDTQEQMAATQQLLVQTRL